MTKLALVFSLLALGAVSASAQIIEVTAVGQVTSTVGTFDPDVHVGDPVTVTYDLALNTPGVVESGALNYTEYNTYASFTAGSFTMVSMGSVNSATVFSGSALYYGYQERSNFNLTVPVYSDLVLLSYSTPAVAPTTALTSIQEFPVSDFDTEAYANFIDNVDEFGVNASLTSYTVRTIAAPEPASFLYGFLVVLAVVALRTRFRGTRV